MKLYGRSFDIRTYEQAQDYLAGREKAKVVNNTYVIRRDIATIALQYHNTDVVTYKADGLIVLNTGGWKTATTKERLNLFSQYGVYVRRGVWYVSKYLGDGRHQELGLFKDGMTLQAH